MEEKGLIRINSETGLTLPSKEDLVQRFQVAHSDLTKSVNGSLRSYTFEPDTYKTLIAEISLRIAELLKYYGEELLPGGYSDLAESIIQTYPDMSPEDVAIFFKSAKIGTFTSPKQVYRLSKPGFNQPYRTMIGVWMKEFQEARADAFEVARTNEWNQLTNEGRSNTKRMFEIFSERLKEAKKKRELLEQEEEIQRMKAIGRKRDEALEEFHRSANIFEHDMRYLTSRDPQSYDRLKKYFDETPPEEQIELWFPMLYKHAVKGIHEYTFGGSHKEGMFKYAAERIKNDFPEEWERMTRESIKNWADDLRTYGHDPKGKSYKEILGSLNQNLPISDLTIFRRWEIVLFYYTNYIGEKA